MAVGLRRGGGGVGLTTLSPRLYNNAVCKGIGLCPFLLLMAYMKTIHNDCYPVAVLSLCHQQAFDGRLSIALLGDVLLIVINVFNQKRTC